MNPIDIWDRTRTFELAFDAAIEKGLTVEQAMGYAVAVCERGAKTNPELKAVFEGAMNE